MKVSFSEEYKKQDFKKFPKFKVGKGQTDRIVVVSDPNRYYVHQVTMPVINPETGEKVQKTRVAANGNEYQVDKTEFVSATMCTGDQEIVGGPDGADPDNCALCKAYVEHAGKFQRPLPKFASLVAKYKTGESDTTPQLDPFVAEILLWVFTQSRFEKILGIANEHGNPVRNLDLLAGPCNNDTYQNYEIAVAGKCVYKESEEAREFIHKAIKSSGIDEELIKSTVANAPTEVSVKITVNKVLERYALEGHGAVGGSAVDLEFNGLAADSHKTAEKAEDNPWGAISEASSKSEEAATPDFLGKPATEEKKEESKPEVDDSTPTSLDDILASLG